MKQLIWTLTLFLILVKCVPISPTSSNSNLSTIEYNNKDYFDNVGNVRITSSGIINNVINQKNNTPLRLSFDLLDKDFRYLTFKIFHCNSDWAKSGISDLEFLYEYNESNINSYEFSQNHYAPYVSYTTQIPPVKLPGNYVIAVYEQGNPETLILTRRFLVYQNNVFINPEIGLTSGANFRSSHHQIRFSVKYSGLQVANPYQDLKVQLLQNHNWNTAILNLLPTSARIDQQLLEYYHFNQENIFPGLNNFRYFDTRSLAYKGQNVYSIRKSDRGIEVILENDKSRKGSAFGSQLEQDLNGRYYTRNNDPNSQDINSEYVWVNFKLNNPKIDGNVFVTGGFNNWQLNSGNMLKFDESAGVYFGSLKLKQGFYNYMYAVQSQSLPYYWFEGSHFDSKNEYEILIYYQAPGTIYDQLVGYQKL